MALKMYKMLRKPGFGQVRGVTVVNHVWFLSWQYLASMAVYSFAEKATVAFRQCSPKSSTKLIITTENIDSMIAQSGVLAYQFALLNAQRDWKILQ